MYKKCTIGRFQFFAGAQKLQWIDGVSSYLEDGNHILMWDWDEIEYGLVYYALLFVRDRYQLPKIYVLESSPGGNWIAYCFKRLPFKKAFVIVADTEHVDWRFVQHSLVRGYFTLRISKKHGVEPKLHAMIPSQYSEDCSVPELTAFVKYQTKAD